MLERPHIEFIQVQQIPWQRIGPFSARPDAEFKFLSRDVNTGGVSAILRYPPNYERVGDEYIDADEEFYVLDGDLEINSINYCFDSYAFLPKFFPRNRMKTKRGAVLLCFFDKEPTLFEGKTNFDEGRLISHIDVLHMPWDRKLNDPNLAHLGISRKDLRIDPITGERTFLSMILPHSEPTGKKGPTECHPVVEEAYMIAGSLTGPHGTMAPGSYFWRPPNIAHGPFGTRWGCVLLVRFLGGQHVNIWSREQRNFDFNQRYDPILPQEMSHLRENPYQQGPRY